MEVRQRSFYPNADTASFNLTLRENDVRDYLQNIYGTLYAQGVADSFEYWSEEDLLFTFENLSQDLKGCVGGKWSRDLARWAVSLAKRKGYIVPVNSTSKTYQLSETIIENAIKKGVKF